MAKRLPSKMSLREFRAVTAEGRACRKKRQGATDGPTGSSQCLKVLGTDLQSFVMQGADWHARC